MSNYNLTLQSNNTDLQAILNTINELPEASGEQAAPVISVNSTNGLITATAGTKSSTHQLAFQPAKTITPSTASQVAVSSGYYTGGNITVAAVPTQTKNVTPKATSQNVTPDSGKFLSKVTVAGDVNLVAGNIKSGVSIFGVSGTLEEGGMSSGEQVEWSANEDAMVTGTLSSYTNDRITTIAGYAFTGCHQLRNISFPNVTTIGNYAFYNCNLLSVNFPNVTTIGSYAFSNCFRLSSIDFPKAIYINDHAFDECEGLSTISFPNVTTIGSYAFRSCTGILHSSRVSFPKAQIINDGAFSSCGKIRGGFFPNVTNIGSYAFNACQQMCEASFPNVTTIGSYAFRSCFNLKITSFPNVKTIGSCAFDTCGNRLSTISFPNVTTIGSYAFRSCFRLSALYLTGSVICTLNKSNAFTSTPIGGYSTSAGTYGSIYVPASLLTSYQTATNWTYFSSRFVGI